MMAKIMRNNNIDKFFLEELKNLKKEAKISFDIIEGISQFQKDFYPASIENAARIITNTNPIKDYRFDENKLLSFCKENNLEVVKNNLNRYYFFKNLNNGTQP